MTKWADLRAKWREDPTYVEVADRYALVRDLAAALDEVAHNGKLPSWIRPRRNYEPLAEAILDVLGRDPLP